MNHRNPNDLLFFLLDSPGDTPGPSGVAAGLAAGVVGYGKSKTVWDVPESSGTQK